MSAGTEPFPAVLLDTCALIFLANGEVMEGAALTAIMAATPAGGVLVSPISAWEVGLLARPKSGVRSTLFVPDPQTWFQRVLDRPGFYQAPFTPAMAMAACFLPEGFHRDPADRMLVATARHLGVPLVTRDARIIAYARAGHLEVVPC
ncbi:MAG: type II toxin-antitoxin system VapC family toxin [Acetobacteraceae bacterium]|nr:type II toxin-antitoxin system VapC family toxin [Acetobacteraceae bacterium]